MFREIRRFTYEHYHLKLTQILQWPQSPYSITIDHVTYNGLATSSYRNHACMWKREMRTVQKKKILEHKGRQFK